MLTGLGCPSGAYDGRLIALAMMVCAGSSLAAFNLLAQAIARRTPAAATLMLALATVASVADMVATPMIGMAAVEPVPGSAVSVRVAALCALVIMIIVGMAFAGISRSGRVLTALAAGALVGFAVVAAQGVDVASVYSGVPILWDRPKTALSVALSLSCAMSAILVFGRGETSGERVGASLLLSLGILSAHVTRMSAITPPFGAVPLPPADVLTRSMLGWVGAAAGALVAASGLVALILNLQARRVRDDHSRDLARRDGLTGLLNGPAFEDSVERALGPDRTGSAALLRLDLDRFEALNAAAGRPAGEAVLAELGRRLTSLDARNLVAARLDAGRFAVLVTGLGSGMTAAAWGQRLTETVVAPFSVCRSRIDPGCSIGMSLSPEHGTAYPVLIGRAEIALAAAKAEGGGVLRLFDADMDARARADASLARDLAVALDDRQLQLDYRPRAEAGSGRLCGFEASLRWLHSERGALDGAALMPLAESAGLALPVGTWMLGQACRDASSWDASLSVAVLLHPAQAFQPDCADIVRQILADTGLDPRRLEIGVSAGHHSFLNDDRALRMLRTLKDMGVRIALCHFGARGASAALGGSFEFDTVKLDASWVKAMARPAEASLAIGIAGLAAALGRTVVAEGVDHHGEVIALLRHGCTHIEGPLVGAPGSVEPASCVLSGRLAEGA